MRLDKYLSDHLPDLSRTRLKSLIKDGFVTLGGKECTPSHEVTPGDLIEIEVPDLVDADPIPQEIPLDILYEDADLVVVNKPVGMVVHPAPGSPDQTLVNALLAHCGASLSGISGVKRPGIVHRLDKGTSGLMVVAKNDFAHQGLSDQFTDRTLSRTYRAIVWGVPNPLEGEIEGAIGRSPRNRKKMAVLPHGGKPSTTLYEVLEVFNRMASFVTCHLKTGRTHQIRVHMTSIGHSLVGDPLYGRFPRGLEPSFREEIKRLTQDCTRPALHAAELKFIHPRTQKKMKFFVEPPQDFDNILFFLKSLSSI